MSILNELANAQNVKGDVPNQKLAKKLAEHNNSDGIKEIVENLDSENKSIQSDCIKVLYEIGYIKPNLISDYANEFINLLNSRNNRLVWGGMIALSTIASLKPKVIFEHQEIVKKALEKGSIITVDAGIKTISRVAASKQKYCKSLFPYLMECLKACRPKSVAQYSESIFEAVSEENKTRFIKVVNDRKDILKPAQLKRVDKLLKKLRSV